MEGDKQHVGGGLSHVGPAGDARMVDVGDKPVTRREARAGGRVTMQPGTLRLLQEKALPKGDVLATARIAAIMAAKRTPELIPMCHALALSVVEVAFDVRMEESAVDIHCRVRAEGRTGVEMEALTGVSAAALTIYDMAKAVDREMVIGGIRLLEKTGGKEDYLRDEEAAAGPATATEQTDPSAGAADTETAGAGSLGEIRRVGRIVSVNVSPGKGERKQPIEQVTVEPGHGIVGDGHAGDWHRQVSLLAQESIDEMVEKGLDVGPGDFAENVTTAGLDLPSLPVGTRLESGGVQMEVTQIGKTCHDRCAIYYQAGDCVMPRDGIFVRILSEGMLRPGDAIRVVPQPERTDSDGSREEGGGGAADE